MTAVGQTVDLLLLTEGRPTPSRPQQSLLDTKIEFTVGSAEVQRSEHEQARRADIPPLIVIVGTALGSFGMMSFLILLGVYKIFPRPYALLARISSWRSPVH